MAKERIVFTVARGKPKFAEMAMGLGRSLKLIGDTNRRVVMTDIQGYDWKRYFHDVIAPTGPRSALDKLTALEVTEADQVLSIDVDMLAFKRLDPIFETCAGRPFAVQGYLSGKYGFHKLSMEEMTARYGVTEIPRFNGGLAYYERGQEMADLLTTMRQVEANYDSYGFDPFVRGQHASEEVCMLVAMIESGNFDYLIPNELQFQMSAAGLVGKLHLDVLKNECRFVQRQESCEFGQPYLFHAWRFKDFLIYWRQLEKLKALEQFEDRHPPMYMSRLTKLNRSVQRRILKLLGRI